MSDEILSKLSAIIEDNNRSERNEAQTRQDVIDLVLFELLAWPTNRVSVEEFVHPGFADYILRKSNGDELLFIEAKKEGVYFSLPIPHSKDETSCYIQIAKLISDPEIKAATNQVREYCIQSGCEYACITNGHEWIFFKIFEKGKRWDQLKAFVVRSLAYFKEEYTSAINALSYIAITEKSTLPGLLTSAFPIDRGIFYPKEKIESFSHTINANRLAYKLRSVVSYYFGVISDEDREFMNRCYVSLRDYQSTSAEMRGIIEDSLTPFFSSYGVQQLDDTGKGGQLGGRLRKSISGNRKGEVLVLFGGKGSGKSTFIKRLLFHNPPSWMQTHAVIAIIDLLDTPEDQTVIRNQIWTELVRLLDTDNVLSKTRFELLNELFADRYAIAQRQDLFGIPTSSELYNAKLNDLVSQWKNDQKYCAGRLVDYWNSRGKGVIVVVDNTDQYNNTNQDFCFSSAQEISRSLGCISVISMREERFHGSKVRGLLDAFQNAGFHISSPKPSEVFKKRLQYLIALLGNERRRSTLIPGADSTFFDESVAYLTILLGEFSSAQSPLTGFLTACAHGNIRLSLELFRSFLLSGYTNVDEMLQYGRWTFRIHQVIKPVMIPTRYFYDENLSQVPNIYQIRFVRNGSHFTSLRILRKLAKNLESNNPAYLPVSQLRAYFADTFNMVDDFVENLDLLLKHGFVESDTRLDYFSSSVDQIKITNYGAYALSQLAFFFTYLDLISTDCGIFDLAACNYLSEAARIEYNHFMRGNKLERVKVRLDRVERLIDYFSKEEIREREVYSLGMLEEDMFSTRLNTVFRTESEIVMASAKRRANRKAAPRS